MTKKELLDAIHGQMIISCQAVKGEPLYVEEKSIINGTCCETGRHTCNPYQQHP